MLSARLGSAEHDACSEQDDCPDPILSPAGGRQKIDWPHGSLMSHSPSSGPHLTPLPAPVPAPSGNKLCSHPLPQSRSKNEHDCPQADRPGPGESAGGGLRCTTSRGKQRWAWVTAARLARLDSCPGGLRFFASDRPAKRACKLLQCGGAAAGTSSSDVGALGTRLGPYPDRQAVSATGPQDQMQPTAS